MDASTHQIIGCEEKGETRLSTDPNAKGTSLSLNSFNPYHLFVSHMAPAKYALNSFHLIASLTPTPMPLE